MGRKRYPTLPARHRVSVWKRQSVVVALLLAAAAARASESELREAGESPLVVSYHTIMCDRPPCLPMRNASRPPDFEGELTLRQQIGSCAHPCKRIPYGSFIVTAEGLSHLAQKVVLHGERRKFNLPYYYMRRLRDGDTALWGKLTIEGDVWFDEKSDRMEILARRIVPQNWEAEKIDKKCRAEPGSPVLSC